MYVLKEERQKNEWEGKNNDVFCQRMNPIISAFHLSKVTKHYLVNISNVLMKAGRQGPALPSSETPIRDINAFCRYNAFTFLDGRDKCREVVREVAVGRFFVGMVASRRSNLVFMRRTRPLLDGWLKTLALCIL